MIKKVTLAILVSLGGMAQAQLRPFYSTTFNKYGYIDIKGKIAVQPKYDFAWEFREGMSLVKLNGKYGYMNEKGIEIITPKYDHAWMFSDGLSVVKIGDKYGFIDQSGKLVVPAIYDRADNFHGDRANVRVGKKWEVMIYPQLIKRQ